MTQTTVADNAERVPETFLALKIALGYALFASLWILLSGYLVARMAPSKRTAIEWELGKAGLFVLVTAVLLGLTLRRYLGRARRAIVLSQQNEQRFRSLFDNMLHGFAYCRMVYDDGTPVDFVYLEVNSAFERLTGLKNVVGKRVTEIIPGIRETDPGLFDIYGRVSSTGTPERFEANIVALKAWFAVSVYSPHRDHFVAVFDLITERKKVEAALRESEARLNFALESSHTGTWDLDLRNHTAHRTMIHARIFGYDSLSPRWTYETFLEHVLPEDRVEVDRRFREATAAEGGLSFECRIRRSDGEVRWIWAAGGHEQSSEGRPVRLSGIVQDVTERKRGEEALRASEEQFRAIFEVASIGLAQADARTGQFLRVNQKMCEITGYSSAEMLQLRFADVTYSEDRQSDWEKFQAVVLGEAPNYQLEKRYVRKDGSVIWVNVNVTAIRDSAGQPMRTIAAVEDITPRKRAEAALRDAESLYHSLVEHLPQKVFRKDREGRFTYVNSHFCALMGETPDNLLGKTVFDLFPQELAEKFHREDQLVMQSQELFDAVQEHKPPAGNSKAVLHVLKAPVKTAAGETIGVQGILTDITNQRELENKFLRAQRLESIGSLASGIAHDLNNILAPIMMCAPLLRGDMPPDDREKMLLLIEASAHRAVGIVKQLLSFGRGKAGEKSVLQVRHLIHEMGKIARETFPRSIQVREHVAADLWLVTADPTQLHQVLLNLCVNARDAMPSGGTLTLLAENAGSDENQRNERGEFSTCPFVKIQVQDTGTGIPMEAREHIFESFFTTKGLEHGTGLGLTTVLGIVTEHHGLITFTTSEGNGTTFEIHLPAVPEPPRPAQAKTTPVDVPRANGELILLVDDEPAVRDATRRTLERHGYSVIEAQDGIDGLAQYNSQRAWIKAVVMDFMMPRMDGLTLARALKRLSAQLPIIVSSGGLLMKNPDEAFEDFHQLGIRHILHKPHNAAALLQALDEALHTEAHDPPEDAESP